MEHAIGTKITLEVVEDNGGGCEDCFFFDWDVRCHISCLAQERTDHKDIIYKEMKDE